jgi:spermidine synthase
MTSFGLEKVQIPEMTRGIWKVEKFKVDRTDWSSALRGRPVPISEEFTRLMRGDTLVMSDTPAEMRDHFEAVYQAKGSCLINGLGLGMVLKAILAKPEVTDVTVVEVAADVIDMVAPNYQDARVTYVCADALVYKPPKGKRYQMVWHDIWDFITADNLPEMQTLHRKYGRRADWQGSWCKDQC